MERRLMIFTYLLLIALCANTVYQTWSSWHEISTSFMEGMNEGLSMNERHNGQPATASVVEAGKRVYDVTLFQKQAQNQLLRDSVYDVNTGKYIPVEITKVNLIVPDKSANWWDILFGICTLFILIAVIGWFLALINSVRKAEIFTDLNISRLRKIGSGLVLIGIIYILVQYLDTSLLQKELDLANYNFSTGGTLDLSVFTNGIIAFLVAEAFAIGLKMKNEQELTI